MLYLAKFGFLKAHLKVLDHLLNTFVIFQMRFNTR